MLNQLLRWCFFIKVIVSSNHAAPATRISAVCLPSVFSALKAAIGLVLHKSRKKSRRNLHKSRISIWIILHKSRFLSLYLSRNVEIFNIVLMQYYFSILCIRVTKLTFAIYGFYPLPQLLAEIAEVIESDRTFIQQIKNIAYHI